MKLDKSTTKKIAGLIAFGILLYLALTNVSKWVGTLNFILGLFSPFLLGLCIALILSVPLRFFERTIFGRVAPNTIGDKLRRPLSLMITLLSVIGVICIVLFLIVPELGRSISTLRSGVPYYLQRLQVWGMMVTERFPEMENWLSTLRFDWEEIFRPLMTFFSKGAGNFFSSTVSAVASVFSGIMTFFLGFVFSIYVLMQKEKLGMQVKMLLYAFLPNKQAEKILSVAAFSGRTFSSFLSGQCAEAVILGFLFFVSMSLLGFPYALMISVLIGFTALIPIFGAFIGCAVGAFLILMVSPSQALWFIVLFLVLQQIEGNLIYPRVVGGSIGLPSIWVLVAVTLGGSTMGIPGMLIFIPLCSVLYSLLRATVHGRLKQKNEEETNCRND